VYSQENGDQAMQIDGETSTMQNAALLTSNAMSPTSGMMQSVGI